MHTHLVKRSEVCFQKSASLLIRKPILGDESFSLSQKPVKGLWFPVDVE